ncbi:hypothetical protein ACJMK2_020130 [Sinanodonta woodiana]|uniref:ZP domain-containing protein n=1 Tax=Sinanodonta woodiana TaxID=1069815 RepID=A0ABD3U0T5_SINWO
MVARTVAQTIEYECLPDGTVRIKNPDNSMYTAVFANNSVNVCHIQREDESTKEHYIITNCEMNLSILVTLMNRPSSHDFILGSTENVHFLIRCSEIPHAGVNKVAEYHLMPLRCDAFPELTSDNVPVKKNIIVNGCSEDRSLVGNFALIKTGEVATELHTFRFYNSPFVTIQCIVRVCPQGSVSCDFSCSGRSALIRDHKTLQDKEETVFTHLTVHHVNEYSSGSSTADIIVAMANSIMLSVISRYL